MTGSAFNSDETAPEGGTATLLALPGLATGIPAPPPASLDPFLDAAARCFARHGIKRTSVQDVARELRVNRATVYRQIGNAEAQVRLLLARDLHRLLASLPDALAGATGPDALVELLATIVTFARDHPVLVKVLADEADLIGPFLVSDLPELVGRVAAAITPLLEVAMTAGVLARRDPAVVAEWVVRLGVSLILAPPPGDLSQFIAELLVPALAPHEEMP
jgi:AcrR family transcriptional regulator